MLIAGFGYLYITVTHAQSFVTSSEAEAGSISNAQLANDSAASGGSAVRFAGSGSVESAYDQLILGDGPVGYYPMQSTTGSEADRTATNSSGTYKNGTLSQSTLPNGDKAATFNGSNQYLEIPSSSRFSIPTTRALTWEAWIKPSILQFPTATDGYVDWMGKCDSYAPTCEWEARMYSTTNDEGRCNRISAYVFNPSAGLGSAADWQPQCSMIQAGKWLHVVGEYQTITTPAECSASQPGDINIWVNGVPWNPSYHRTTGCMSQYEVIPKANNSTVAIGTMSGDYWFAGSIGKVAFYDKLLTQSQISEHYRTMTGLSPSGSCANTCTASMP